ncbi:MAG: hypothetical protein NZ932_07250 [Candidatus Bathyarchaeota archaeon]|nr:hypothetical protein [Candidatus Bathyarchaeota archaeon]
MSLCGLEKATKQELQRIIERLWKKAEEFKTRGDLSRAEQCMFLARYLEEFLNEQKRAKAKSTCFCRKP